MSAAPEQLAAPPGDDEPDIDTPGGDEPDIHTTAGKLADLARRTAELADSEATITRQHDKGRQTAR
ncbi:MAG TPA: methylmalonyl-CoA carboxyltransferase, partial [Actinophytocola sp.]|nr:methylmalonyl-CoA carboxyltransferase [Actinophytocola sp.]